MAGREQGGRAGLPGGAAAGGPDGGVEALLAEHALGDRERHRRTAMVVGRCDQPGGPAEQPGLDLRGAQERDRPCPVGRSASGVGPSGLGRQAGGQLDQPAHRPRGCGGHSRVTGGVDGAHGRPLRSWSGARAAQWPRARRRAGDKIPGTGPSGRLASAGGRSRAPGPGTRAGPVAPRGEAGAIQGGVPLRRHKPKGAVAARGVSRRRARGSRLYRIATISWRCGCRIALTGWGIRLWFDRFGDCVPRCTTLLHRLAGTDKRLTAQIGPVLTSPAPERSRQHENP